MVTYTANKNLAEPARGEYLGTWDTPVNSNTSILDSALGGYTTVALSNANVVLSPPQYQNTFIAFTSTAFGGLAASVVITLPPVGSFYTVQNLTSNTSSFTVTLATTVAGGQYIAIPPGEPIDVFTDGTNVKFRNLARVGSYWDYAGSSVPNWVSGCSVPPYLNCDGSVFSSAAYPVLATILGGTTLPDSKGRYRLTLNQGSGRVTSSAGIDGNTLLAGGGVMSTTLTSSYLPYLSSANGGISISEHYHQEYGFASAGSQGTGGNSYPMYANNFAPGINLTKYNTDNNTSLNISIGSTSPSGVNTISPSYVGGITMIRAA